MECKTDNEIARGGNFRYDLKTRHESNMKVMGLGQDFKGSGQNQVKPD